jgi:hypothetical protein
MGNNGADSCKLNICNSIRHLCKCWADILGFEDTGGPDYKKYLIVEEEGVEIHFFEFKELEPNENYGQVYIRTDDIDGLYQYFLSNRVAIHPKSLPMQGRKKSKSISINATSKKYQMRN